MQDNSTSIPNKVRTSEMKSKLIETARDLFSSKGYAETSTPEIVKQAGVTRGALYHHFNDKKGLFRAVIQHEAEQVAEYIKAKSAMNGSGKETLISGTLAYFDAISVPGRAELLLIDGPAVLGLVEIAEIDALTSGDDLKDGLEYAVKLGEIKPMPTKEMADILSAAFDRAALSSINNPSQQEQYKASIRLLIEALFD